MHKPTPSAKRLQRNQHHATMRLGRSHVLADMRSPWSHIEASIEDKMGLERKMDVHHKRKRDA